jgi:hypothetical protein
VYFFRLPLKYCDLEFFGCLDFVSEPANRGTIAVSHEFLDFIHRSEYRDGFSSLSILDESLGLITYGMVFRPFNPFFEMLNEKLHQMISSGVMKLWHDFQKNRKMLMKSGLKVIGPEVLTLEHLWIGFVFCSIPLFISMVTFCLEHWHKRFARKNFF